MTGQGTCGRIAVNPVVENLVEIAIGRGDPGGLGGTGVSQTIGITVIKFEICIACELVLFGGLEIGGDGKRGRSTLHVEVIGGIPLGPLYLTFHIKVVRGH